MKRLKMCTMCLERLAEKNSSLCKECEEINQDDILESFEELIEQIKS